MDTEQLSATQGKLEVRLMRLNFQGQVGLFGRRAHTYVRATYGSKSDVSPTVLYDPSVPLTHVFKFDLTNRNTIKVQVFDKDPADTATATKDGHGGVTMAEDYVDIRPWIANGRFEGDHELLHNGMPCGVKVQLAVKLTYPGRKREKKYKGDSAALRAAQAVLASESTDLLTPTSSTTPSVSGPPASPSVTPKVLAALLGSPDDSALPSPSSEVDSGSLRAKGNIGRPSFAATRAPPTRATLGAGEKASPASTAPPTPQSVEKTPLHHSAAVAAVAAVVAAAGGDKEKGKDPPKKDATVDAAVEPLFKPDDRHRIFATLTDGEKKKKSVGGPSGALPTSCPQCQGSSLIAAPVFTPQSPQRPPR